MRTLIITASLLALAHAHPSEDVVILKGPSGIVTSKGPIGPTGPATGGLEGGWGEDEGKGWGVVAPTIVKRPKILWKEIVVPERRLVATPVLKKEIVAPVVTKLGWGGGWGGEGGWGGWEGEEGGWGKEVYGEKKW